METGSEKRFGAKDMSSFIMSFYLLFMLGVFPLYYRSQYYKMGDWKYKLFQNATGLCVLILFFFSVALVLWSMVKNRNTVRKNALFCGCTIADVLVLIYFVATTISYFLCNFKKEGFFGSNGWYMGYLSQLLFMAVYFMVSRAWHFQYEYLVLLLTVSAVVFSVGILHRFDVDAFWIYGDLETKYKTLFLSTIGQSSWYAGFLCAVFPLGMYFFYAADTLWIRLAAGIFSVLSMCTLVTQNTDSAFLSLAVVLVFLFYLAFDGKKQMYRFTEVLLLVFCSFTLMGVCQRMFKEHVIPIDNLSFFMSKGWISPVIFTASAVVYMYQRVCEKRTAATFCQHSGKLVNTEIEGLSESKEALSRKPFRMLLTSILVVITVVILFIVLNSYGLLYTWFGYRNVDNYLLFSDTWGNQRGFAWRFTLESFAGLPWQNKLFGVGPDCFAPYNNSVAELGEKVRAFWGNLSLTNAHNEYLTKLYDIGIFGVLSYLGMMGGTIYLFFKKRREHILLPGFALCMISYLAYLIFCYEQVCCTPFVYIFMGFGSNLIYNNAKKSTY